MPTREEILNFVTTYFNTRISNSSDAWVAIYQLLLDYEHGVPRITDSNRLKSGIWRARAQLVEQALAGAIGCDAKDVEPKLNQLMRNIYVADTQRMNPVGTAFACSIVYLIKRFASRNYKLRMEAAIGSEVFPTLLNFRRKNVDIVAWVDEETLEVSNYSHPHAVVSSKWGIRHDRIRDPQEEADTYKQHSPGLQFFVTTNEFDSARLQKLISYPTIDGVFHVNLNLVTQLYSGILPPGISRLRDLSDLISYF